jgi:hypothetical protein
MAGLVVPIATNSTTASVLTLVLPLGVLIVVAIWYVILWSGKMGQP